VHHAPYTEHMENCRLNYYLDIILLFCHVDCSCEALWVGSCLTECHLHTGTYYIRRYTQEFMVHKLPEPKDKDLRPYIPSLAPLSWDQKFFTICWHIFVGVTNNNTHKIHNTNTHCNAELSHRHTNLKTICYTHRIEYSVF